MNYHKEYTLWIIFSYGSVLIFSFFVVFRILNTSLLILQSALVFRFIICTDCNYYFIDISVNNFIFWPHLAKKYGSGATKYDPRK